MVFDLAGARGQTRITFTRVFELGAQQCNMFTLVFELAGARGKTKTIRLQATQLDKVVVATDDERIAKVCR